MFLSCRIALCLLQLSAWAVAATCKQQQQPLWGSKKSCDCEKGDFVFENPRRDCKFASQPYIYELFSEIAGDTSVVFEHIAPDAHFTVMGHHPFAGSYHDVRMVYSNSLWRLYNCLKDREVDAYVTAIHGGCDDRWAVMEFHFNATTNRGLPWELSSLWVTRWDEKNVIQEVRTYVDAGQIMRTLWDNEIWYNSSELVEHTEFMPGPGGLPPFLV